MVRRVVSYGLSLSVGLSVLWGAVVLAQAPQYTVRDLGLVFPLAVTSGGAVVGERLEIPPDRHVQALLIHPDGTHTLLGALFGEESNIPVGLQGGRVVGCAPVSVVGPMHAYLWTARAGMTDLGLAWNPAVASCGHAVDKRGVVVGAGEQQLPGGGRIVNRAVRWARTGKAADLGTLGGASATAFAMNQQGDIVGFAQTGNTLANVATLWPGNGDPPVNLDLGSGSVSSAATAVTSFLEIGGNVLLPGFVQRAFVLQIGEPMQLLPPLPGDTSSRLGGLNDDGTPVGRSLRDDITRPVSTAVVWVDGHPVALHTLVSAPGWVFTEARGINQAGQIIVRATLNGQPRGALLTPTGAPRVAKR